MAEETKQTVEEVVVPEAEKEIPPPEKAVETTEKPPVEPPASGEAEVSVVAEEKIAQQNSFKEETNVVDELPESQKKALNDLKKLIQDALNKREFSSPPPPPPPSKAEKPAETPAEEVVAPTKAEEPQKTEEKTEEPTKTEENTEETPKTEEPQKTEESSKAEEPQKTEEPTKTEEPQKTKEPQKTEDPTKTEEPTKAEEVEVEVKKEEEDIKETIVVEVAAAVAPEVEENPKEAAEEAKAEETEKTEEPEEPKEPEEVSIWGIPLLSDERSDVILLKFLRARDFKVKEAFTMIRNTARWRKEYNVDTILDEDLGNEYEKVVFTHGFDKIGRPVCYNVFGEFQNKELYP